MRRACERGVRVFDYGRSKHGHRLVRLQEELGLRAAAAALRVLPVPAATRAAEQPAESEVPRFHRAVAAPAASGRANWLGPHHRAQPGLRRVPMEPLLYLAHRMPYPAQQGRQGSFVPPAASTSPRATGCYLGTFVDDPADWRHVEALRALCADAHVAAARTRCASAPAQPARASSAGEAADAAATTATRACSLGRPRRWPRAGHRAVRLVFSSAMAQYVRRRPGCAGSSTSSTSTRRSGREYAHDRRWPISSAVRREARHLLDYEREVAARADASFFVTDEEAAALPQPRARVRAARRATSQRRGQRVLLARASFASPFAARRAADRLHRRDGLLAQRRRRHVVRARGARPVRRSATLPRALLRRRNESGPGGAGPGERSGRRS